ncbi:Exocyst complex component sec15 [Ceratocystis lukuohia]|uniref:Exocyst complex component SEC15 n=1 Tax=Ceratocystis lukuohia TaxID=2019550 RepID=A0ABR4MFU0_9PEZI
MSRRTRAYDDYQSAVEGIILPPAESDFIDQLIPILKDAATTGRTSSLMQSLSSYANGKEAEIEQIGLTQHGEFLASVNQLQQVRETTVFLTTEIMGLNESIQSSTEKLAAQKQVLVNTRATRQNLGDASSALQESLRILHAVNNAHELIRKKKYYAALKSLDDLQNEHLIPTIQNKYATQQRLADVIQKSIPSSQRIISDAVMTDLNTWLFRIRETSQFLGEVAFYHTELRRERQRERVKEDPYMSKFKLNSAIELVCDDGEEFDVLDNDELQIDFTPLFECLHIHESLGQSERFRAEYSATRRQQKDLLLPGSIDLLSDGETSLSALLEGIAGFAIIEKATLQRVPQLRSLVDVEELWDSMCQTSMSLTSRALNDVSDAEGLLKIKGYIAIFIQTMEGWGYSVSMLDGFLLTLFQKYSDLLKHRFSEDFQEIVSTDDYMPMAIQSAEEYEKVVNVSWFNQEKPVSELTSLVDKLASQYLSQIVQILINLEHFEIACQELEQLLIRARSSTSAGGPVSLRATTEFRNNKKTAEKRIFEVVNSKIDDLVDTAEYNWMSSTPPTETSNYMQTLTTYLSNIMNSTLLGLPREIKELIYFDALSHAANKILALPLSQDVKYINSCGVAALAKDVHYLTDFVDSLENGAMLRENLDELQQTINLMQSDNHDEFFDISTRNKKYGRVDPLNGPILLEKVTSSTNVPSATSRTAAGLANFSSRFGGMMNQRT